MNNFERLQEEHARQFEGLKKRKVQQSLLQTFGIFKFVGQLIDVYLPAMVDVLVSSMGGKMDGADNDKKPVSRNLPPSLGDDHPGKTGPELPGSLDELR